MCSNVNKGWICVQANVKHWSPGMYGQLVVLFPASCASTAAAEFQSGVCVGLIPVADVGSASLHGFLC